MIQKVKGLPKILFIIGVIFLLFPQLGMSQVVSDTTKTIEIENPLFQSPQQYKVLGIEVTGLTRTSPAFVISQLGFSEGSTITIPGEDIAEGVKRIYQTGLFAKVKIFRTRTTPEGVYLEVHVQEQPQLRAIKIKGVKKSQREDLKDRINLIPGL